MSILEARALPIPWPSERIHELCHRWKAHDGPSLVEVVTDAELV